MNSKTLTKKNQTLRTDIVNSLEYSIRELTSLLESAKQGEIIYSNVFSGSTMISLPSKIEVLRELERLADDMKFIEENP